MQIGGGSPRRGASAEAEAGAGGVHGDSTRREARNGEGRRVAVVVRGSRPLPPGFPSFFFFPSCRSARRDALRCAAMRMGLCWVGEQGRKEGDEAEVWCAEE